MEKKLPCLINIGNAQVQEFSYLPYRFHHLKMSHMCHPHAKRAQRQWNLEFAAAGFLCLKAGAYLFLLVADSIIADLFFCAETLVPFWPFSRFLAGPSFCRCQALRDLKEQSFKLFSSFLL